MQIIDLTQITSEKMPVYPGTEPPSFKKLSTVEQDSMAETFIQMTSHTGTHIDAPAHMIQGGRTLDTFKAIDFVGNALVIDVSNVGSRIGFEDLLPYSPWIQDVKYVFFKTGWSRYWGTSQYMSGFPALTKKAANWLCEQRVRGVGIDALSIDSMETDTYPIHKILLGCEMIVIENLTNLEGIPEQIIKVACLPIKIEDADGAPARVIALVE